MRQFLHIAAAALAIAIPLRPIAGERPPDSDVKAALVFNFLKFVEWGDTAKPLEVCVIGETRVLQALSALAGRSIAGRKVTVRHAVADELRGCRVAFLAPSEDVRVETLSMELARERVLVIGDGPAFAARGAHLNFYVVEDRVRFEANVGAMRRDGIAVSSKLLRLARIVEAR